MADYLIHFNPYHDKLGRFDKAPNELHKNIKKDISKGLSREDILDKYGYSAQFRKKIEKSKIIDAANKNDQEVYNFEKSKIAKTIVGKYSNEKIKKFYYNNKQYYDKYKDLIDDIIDYSVLGYLDI